MRLYIVTKSAFAIGSEFFHSTSAHQYMIVEFIFYEFSFYPENIVKYWSHRACSLNVKFVKSSKADFSVRGQFYLICSSKSVNIKKKSFALLRKKLFLRLMTQLNRKNPNDNQQSNYQLCYRVLSIQYLYNYPLIIIWAIINRFGRYWNNKAIK